jgi:hypothetical protein
MQEFNWDRCHDNRCINDSKMRLCIRLGYLSMLNTDPISPCSNLLIMFCTRTNTSDKQ